VSTATAQGSTGAHQLKESKQDVHRLAAAFAAENVSDAEKNWASAESKYSQMISRVLADVEFSGAKRGELSFLVNIVGEEIQTD
jgi:hypothetical protein